jgi:hypothetical protein
MGGVFRDLNVSITLAKADVALGTDNARGRLRVRSERGRGARVAGRPGRSVWTLVSGRRVLGRAARTVARGGSVTVTLKLSRDARTIWPVIAGRA